MASIFTHVQFLHIGLTIHRVPLSIPLPDLEMILYIALRPYSLSLTTYSTVQKCMLRTCLSKIYNFQAFGQPQNKCLHLFNLMFNFWRHGNISNEKISNKKISNEKISNKKS
jgi:hypothetical protein